MGAAARRDRHRLRGVEGRRAIGGEGVTMTEQYPEFLQAADQRRREDEGRAAVVDYLCSLGVDESVASGAWIAVQLAVGRHAEKIAEQHAEKTAKARGKGIKKIYDDKAAKDNLEEIERAAERLVEAIEKSSDYAWNQLATEATRIIRRSAFEADVRMVRDSAADALGRLKLNGKPVGAKAALVDELAMIWRRATGKMPDKSEGQHSTSRTFSSANSWRGRCRLWPATSRRDSLISSGAPQTGTTSEILSGWENPAGQSEVSPPDRMVEGRYLRLVANTRRGKQCRKLPIFPHRSASITGSCGIVLTSKTISAP
jgi:hypothetical protein